MVGFALDRANTAAHVRELHIRTESDMNLLRARVKAEIDMDLSMVQDLANLTSISNAASREEMERQINWLLIQNPAFIHIAVAPGFIVGDVYPPGPGSERIGRDVREELFSRQAMTRAAGDQLARFYGPITTNGRDAFAIFFPVFVRENGHRRLWGAVEVAIDRKMFYEATGLTPSRDSENQERYPNLDHLSIAVRDIGPTAGKTDAAAPFFGSAGIDDKDPIRRQISFAGGKWELSAVPKDSWSAVPENRTELLLIVVAAGCIIVVPIFFATLLLGERNRNIAELETREAKLMELSQRLNLALESSNIGIWELQDHSNSLLWDARAAALHGKPAEEGSRPLDEWLAAILPADRDIARCISSAAASPAPPARRSIVSCLATAASGICARSAPSTGMPAAPAGRSASSGT